MTTTQNSNVPSFIFQRIRRNNGEPVGIVLSTVDSDGYIHIGWSHRNRAVDKRHDKELEWMIAFGRAFTKIQWEHFSNTPRVAKKLISQMRERSARYFKQNKGFWN
jgi:hypothetical protein